MACQNQNHGIPCTVGFVKLYVLLCGDYDTMVADCSHEDKLKCTPGMTRGWPMVILPGAAKDGIESSTNWGQSQSEIGFDIGCWFSAHQNYVVCYSSICLTTIGF